MINKIIEMELAAYMDYSKCALKHGEDSERTMELKYRWLGMLEMKKELLREPTQRNEIAETVSSGNAVSDSFPVSDSDTGKE